MGLRLVEMAKEEIHFAENARLRKTQKAMGMGFPTSRFMALQYREEWEKVAMSLPVIPDNDPPPQNSDGTFRFTIGVDPLGGAPL